MSSRSEALTAQFYAWEILGRGWHSFDKPVQLEPVFIPFFGHILPGPKNIDDGKRHTPISYLTESVRNVFAPNKPVSEEVQIDYEPHAYYFESDEGLDAFSMSLPEGEKLQAEEITQFLIMLSYTKAHMSFEIIATSAYIRLQFVCRKSDTLHIQSQLKAYFPACIIHNHNDTASIISEGLFTYISEFGLQEEYMVPIAAPEKFDSDPLTGLFGTLEQLRHDEQVVIQVLFKGTGNPWAESIMRSVTDGSGDSFFADAPEMPKYATEKTSSPLFAVVVRVVAQSVTSERAFSLLERIGLTLMQSSKSAINSLALLNSAAYDFGEYLQDVLYRRSRRTGMLLNTNELATFVHYPYGITSRKLERDLRKKKAPPPKFSGHDFILGKSEHEGQEVFVTEDPTQRLKHTHVIGATGTGKSTFLQACIVQDILLGNGVAVLDPHGDLIESVLPYIPENRYEDVIIVDPSDADYPVGFNILTAHSDIEKEILASDLVAVFRRLSTSFGDQMHSVLANAILAYVESTVGGTLIDLRRFLIEKPFREIFLRTVTDPNVVYYWQKEYPLLKSNSIGPILTRLDSFLRPKVIRNMVAQKKSLDFANILDSRKLLFIKLSQGLIGNENSYLLGTFFVSKIYQAAMARQAQTKEDRKNFFLYVDEFQNFITPSMSAILSGTRKYGLGCILAHQDMLQLNKQDAELGSAVISNAGTRVCFRLGDIDARRFEDGFSFFEAQDLQNLGTGQAIVRIERPEFDFSMSTLELNPPQADSIAKETVIYRSRQQYGTPREDVEQALEYLRGENHSQEEQNPVAEVKAAEPLKKQPAITESVKPDSVIEIPAVDEQEKIKTAENLARQKTLSQHRYLQTLIKRMAEARGYKATIEELTPEGQGRVDVSLEKNGKRIACEIGVTTSKEWEVHNIEKCLAAGYEVVVSVPIDKRASEVMKEQIKNHFSSEVHSRVFVMQADELFQYLDMEIAKEAATETRIKGYRVKVEYDAISEDKMKQKRESVTRLVADSLRKKKTDE